jgi:DNA-binding MarR family transcriptional regulator
MAVKSPRASPARRAPARKGAGEEPRLGMLVKRAEQAMIRAKTSALKSIGLTPAQYVALHELDAQPGITAATLARACLVTPQAMMILLKSMEQQGLITRSLHPRHANVLELHMTDVGHEALHSARQRVEPVEAHVFGAYSARELAVFREHLARFIKAFESA